MRFRVANPNDVPEIVKLEQQVAEAAHWTLQQYQKIFSSGGLRRLVWVADDGNLQGFLVARSGLPEWELENIAVAEAAQRRGVGGQLLKSLIERAHSEGAEAILLEVRESNRAARSLYQKWGFRELGRRANYYRDPLEDAVIYRFCFL